MERKLSLREITERGRKFYLEGLKDALERDHMGDYVVIDVENKRYEMDADEYDAIKRAQKNFGKKLFYIVKVGEMWETHKAVSQPKYAWYF